MSEGSLSPAALVATTRYHRSVPAVRPVSECVVADEPFVARVAHPARPSADHSIL